MLSIFFILFTFIKTKEKKNEKEKEKPFTKMFTQWKLFNEHSSFIQSCLQTFLTHFFICLDNFFLTRIANISFSAKFNISHLNTKIYSAKRIENCYLNAKTNSPKFAFCKIRNYQSLQSQKFV